MTSPMRFNVGGLWKRWGHSDIDPNPPAPPAPSGYDYTINPYGTAYDSTGGAGGYIPDATHSGVPAGTTFTQTITGTGGVWTPPTTGGSSSATALEFDAIDFHAYVKFAATSTGYYRFKRPRFRGPAQAQNNEAAGGLVYNTSSAIVEVYDSDSYSEALNTNVAAFFGKNFRIYRPHWWDVVDGIDSLGNVECYGFFAEKAMYSFPDYKDNSHTTTWHSDGSHCDILAQISGGAHHWFIGGQVSGFIDPAHSQTTDTTNHPLDPTKTYPTSDILIKGSITDVLMQHCLLGGAGYAVNIASGNYPNLGRIVNNRFKRDSKFATAPNPDSSLKVGDIGGTGTVHLDTTGNVWDNDGTTMPPYIPSGNTLVYP